MESTIAAPNLAGPLAETNHFLSGTGEMAEMIRQKDWSKTPLGPIESWPQSLRTTVSLCLSSTFPINIIWGPDHTQIYNDGYRVVCGGVHPRALGEDYSVTWASAWPAIGESFERALAGERMYTENRRMFLERLHGALEETFFTFSHSPIRDESGGLGGLFHPVTETTATMLAERRTRALRDLAASLGVATDEAEVARRTVEILSRFEFDLPFLLYYALDPKAANYRLAAHHGVASGGLATPLIIERDAAPWPVADALGTLRILEVGDLPSILRGEPCGPYEEPPDRGFVVPIVVPAAVRPPAVIVTGASSRLPLNADYRSFYDLLGVTVSGALATVRAREDERRRAEALAEIDRAKTLFFSNVSHEFRTPLTLMLGPLGDALANAGLPASERERVEVAHRNGLRLLKLVNTLLDFSRIEAGRAQASYEPTDLAAFTAELASNFRSACERAGLALVVDCPPLPEPIFVDRDMWEKIVLNLVSNAFKFTHQGEIGVTLRLVGDAAELAVRDTGVGIPEAELPRVFERFHRVEGARGRTYEGSGIGLALVHELVKLHGGAVRVDSVPGRGSTFTVSVPVGSAHLPADRIEAARTLASTAVGASAFVEEALRWLPDGQPGGGAAPPAAIGPTVPIRPAAAAPATDGGPARILWADDNADMRDYVSRLLSGRYAVEAVADGAAALAAAKTNLPDLVLADVMMPQLDGFGLLRDLRADPRTRDLPVILLSARAGEESKVEGYQAGADDYLVKPFSARELLARIQTHLNLASIRREAAAREAELRAEAEFALDAGKLGSWQLDLPTGALTSSDRCKANFGLRPEDDLSYARLFELIHLDDRDRVRNTMTRAIEEQTDYDCEYRITRPDGSLRWIHARGRGVYGADGLPLRIAGIALDITQRKTAEEKRKLLVDELNHRVKNTLATVQSIATQTFTGAVSIDEGQTAFQARLIALSKMHDLLTEDHWESAALREVVRGALAPHGIGDSPRFTIDGPDMRLQPKAALALGMAIHELATNAAKYGALSSARGQVRVGWDIERSPEGARLRLRWTESGGPRVAPPRRKGFGSLMIERGLRHDLGSDVQLRYDRSGVVCAMDIPLPAAQG